MKTFLGSVALSACIAVPAHAQDDPLTDVIVVTAARASEATTDITLPDGTAVSAPDSAGLVARLPGAALIDNGGISGQVQYRGLFGDRVLIRINDQRFQTGGPNSMDPPMHYAPMPLIDRVEVDRGIGPVRDGPGLAGGVNARLKQVDFTDTSAVTGHYDASALYRSVDDSRAVGGVAGLANDRFRFNLLGSYEEGENMRFPGGRVRDSGFRRDVFGLSTGYRTDAGEFGLELRRQETGHSGNAPFAMDIIYFDTNFARASFKGDVGRDIRIEAGFGYAGVRHGMDNHTLRPAPANPAMKRYSYAEADSFTGNVRLTFGPDDRHLSVGGDFEQADKAVRITNPDNAAFFIDSLPGIDLSRLGGFAEWRGALGGIETELGLRVDHHAVSAGSPVLGMAVPAGPRMLATAFAKDDRQWSDETVDLVARLWREAGAFTPRLTLARKTRAPNPVERFAWLPTEASGGLADGNIYVGNMGLKPETAWIAEAGFDWRTGSLYARPTIFYRRIDNYVQGVPFDATPGVADTTVEMVSAMNGDATPLRFANVDAELYGFDMDFGARLTDNLRVDGVASYVRGKRRDIADNLYRVAPPTLRLAATWEEARWSVTAETVGTARQRKVSRTNGEAASSGYVLVNLLGEWTVRPGLSLSAGVENLFNRHYLEHLAGYNRVSGSDVAVGSRLPGAGRGGFVRLRAAY